MSKQGEAIVLKFLPIIFILQEHTLALADDQPTDTTDGKKESGQANRKALAIDLSNIKPVEIVPVVSPTSIAIDKAGLPLAIFTKVNF